MPRRPSGHPLIHTNPDRVWSRSRGAGARDVAAVFSLHGQQGMMLIQDCSSVISTPDLPIHGTFQTSDASLITTMCQYIINIEPTGENN